MKKTLALARSKMNKILLITVILMAWAFGVANATTISDPANGEQNLKKIWKTLFNETFATSQALFNAYGVPDGSDYLWYELDGGVYVDVRYASYGQAFGYRKAGVDTQISLGTIKPGYNYEKPPVIVNIGGTFNWYEQWTSRQWTSKRTSRGTTGKWYSDNSINKDGELDHFVALRVPEEQVKWYNEHNHKKPDLDGNVYLLCFEDLNLGDKDYNDLVVLVDRVAPIPEPATMFLLGSGLLGLAAFARRKFRKS